jgi:hypothetical protein
MTLRNRRLALLAVPFAAAAALGACTSRAYETRMGR